MAVSLSELDSRCYISLAPAAEYLDVSVVHNAVVQRLNIRTMKSRISTAHVLLATTSEFTPGVLDYDVTSLIGKSVPCFVEQKWVSQDTLVSWQNIRVVPLSQINDYRAMGGLACAFYGEEPAASTAQATQYLRFTYLPGQVCRIRFDRDGQRTALDANILLPDNLAELVVREAQNDLIPTMQLAIQMRLRQDEDLRKDAQGIIAALTGIFAQNLIIIKELDALWKVWAFSDRAKESNFNLPTPSSASMYGGRGGRGYGGFGGSY